MMIPGQDGVYDCPDRYVPSHVVQTCECDDHPTGGRHQASSRASTTGFTIDELPVHQWECQHVAQWLTVNGFSEYIDLLCTQHRLDGPALLTLSETDLRQPSQEIKILGDRKRMMICIKKIQSENHYLIHELSVQGQPITRITCHQEDYITTNGKVGRISQSLDPEYFKLLVSYLYMFTSSLVASIVLVFVHDRLPDMKRYAPLPDLVLDSIPYMPGAFEMSEFTAVSLVVIWLIVLFFHKHRFILMRRTFFLIGCMYILRCVTILITSLPVPGTHLYKLCLPKGDVSLSGKLQQALNIIKSFGMSIFGVRTCGDYIFSGHAAILTLLTFFITEYTPRRAYWLHISTWILNMLGIFFILANHDHYTIDVFLSFYIMSRLFIYYHVLANNRALLQMNNRKTRIWFPLFSFFESKVNGIVPNEYEWPLPWPQFVKIMFNKNKKRK